MIAESVTFECDGCGVSCRRLTDLHDMLATVICLCKNQMTLNVITYKYTPDIPAIHGDITFTI